MGIETSIRDLTPEKEEKRNKIKRLHRGLHVSQMSLTSRTRVKEQKTKQTSGVAELNRLLGEPKRRVLSLAGSSLPAEHTHTHTRLDGNGNISNRQREMEGEKREK